MNDLRDPREQLNGITSAVDGADNSGYNENKEWRRSYVYQESGRRNFAQRL